MNVNEEDVVVEILLRLPVQSLIRYKCVCKKWRDLIESCDFVNKHLSGNRRRIINVKYLDNVKYFDYNIIKGKNFLSCYDNYDEFLTKPVVDDVELLEFSEFGSLNFATHSNGIVCMTDYQDSSPIILFNPALREVRTVPPCPFRCHNDPYYGYGYGVYREPDVLFAVGFGFDDTIENYKVVRMVILANDNDIEAQVYDLSTLCWRKSNRMHISILNDNCPLCPLVFFNGILHHYVATMATTDRLVINTFSVLTFNITTELFQVMEFPHNLESCHDPTGKNMKVYHSIFAMDESTLALVAFAFPSSPSSCCSQLDVWVMKEYGVRESWTKQYSITSPHSSFGKPLSLWSKYELLFITTDGILICYNLLTGQQRQLRQYPIPTIEEWIPEDLITCTFGVLICNESLVSINRISLQTFTSFTHDTLRTSRCH